MLRKLLKHEFRATARIMLPLFGLLVLASVGAPAMLVQLYCTLLR